MMTSMAPTLTEVLAFELLPIDASASRRAVVRLSDGSTGEADELRSLEFRRDRDYLQ